MVEYTEIPKGKRDAIFIALDSFLNRKKFSPLDISHT